MQFDIIAAIDERFGIGKNGTIPWHCPEDMAWFKEQTKDCVCIVGRKTYHSLPAAARFRLNCYVVTGQNGLDGLVPTFSSFDAALNAARSWGIMVIGGAQVYAEALDHPKCRYLYLTKIKGKYNCDTFFPLQRINKFQSVAYHRLSENALVDVYEKVDKWTF